MIKYFVNKIFGTRNERELKKLNPIINKINSLEKDIKGLSDEDLKKQTNLFREQLKSGKKEDDILPQAFAVVREASVRTLGMRHFDVQLLGGIILHQGRISEMKTGEGKTLVATLAGYLNAISGKGVHIVTVNDYLATRDSAWMGEVFRFLGLSVGVIYSNMEEEDRRDAYRCDITYGTNNEFGFDYLRDNMKFDADDLVQRGYHYAIVDEVDSILIDEARTPLIISGPTEESTSFYYTVNDFIKRIKGNPKTYEKDEKSKTVVLTDLGIAEAEKFFKIDNLYDLRNMDTLHQVNQSLKAHHLFIRDKDYLVKDNQVMIVDEFTGRMMDGRRYSDGLHQALEAKENVKIEQEYQTLAQVTFQNYFRMYKKLSGMTGTAITEAIEFSSIYNLDVAEIPTNKPLIRKEHPDVIYGSTEEKWDAVVNAIKELGVNGQPVLVGTISIENSELLSRRLRKEKVKHEVLNAKYHEMEAEIVAQAGRPGAITIATNMAGRGTDIILGGSPDFMINDELKRRGYTKDNVPEDILNEIEISVRKQQKEDQKKVLELGGLHILGTERHEARRIDNQLRGRAGRQGDPGSSRFYISLEDDLMKILGSDKMKGMLVRAGMTNGVPIENRFVSKAIENAQKQIEGQNFSTRKHLLEYDDVMNKQRQVIYSMREEILKGKDYKEHIRGIVTEIFNYHFENYIDENKESEEWDIKSFEKEILAQYGLDLERGLGSEYKKLPHDELKARTKNYILDFYEEKEKALGSEYMRKMEQYIMLEQTDSQWKDHLKNIDHLKEGIGLRGYAQKDPLIEYKRESFDLFEELQNRIEEDIIRYLYLFQPIEQEVFEDIKRKRKSKLSKPVSKLPGRRKKKKKKK
jgi:preprotein translocase subunit SecA